MFNRYWRDYPWFLQMILFGLMVFTFVSFFTLIAGIILPPLTGFNIKQIANVNEYSSRGLINAAILLQAITAVGVFMIPPVLFANLTHPSIGKYLSLKKPKKPIRLLLVICLFLSSLPLFLELGSLMKMIDLGKGATDMQNKIDNMEKAFLDMKSGADLLKGLLVMALIPAVGEELFFRGVLFRVFYQKNHRFIFSGFLTSVLFSLAHATPYNLVPIFIAGALLCYTFYLTGSMYNNILGHFVYNGSQIVMLYLAANNNSVMKEAMEKNHLPVYITVISTVVFAGSLFLLWKNRTPLQPDWADNFTQQELDERAQDPTVL